MSTTASLRVYLQVQRWLGSKHDKTDYKLVNGYGNLIPKLFKEDTLL